jgi:hypothetical protein
VYHGFGKRPPFFEGWYFKMVDATEQHRCGDPGAIGQMQAHPIFSSNADGVTGNSTYHRYPFESLFRQDRLDIRAGPNRFPSTGSASTSGALNERCKVNFTGSPMAGHVHSSRIMGWYALVRSWSAITVSQL